MQIFFEDIENIKMYIQGIGHAIRLTSAYVTTVSNNFASFPIRTNFHYSDMNQEAIFLKIEKVFRMNVPYSPTSETRCKTYARMFRRNSRPCSFVYETVRVLRSRITACLEKLVQIFVSIINTLTWDLADMGNQSVT